MFRIDDDMKEFLETGLAVAVATADLQGRPYVANGWGIRVNEERTGVSLFLEKARADRTLEDLEATRRLAIIACSPVSYRAVQLKGRATGCPSTNDEDAAWVKRHRDAFIVETSLVGDPPLTIRNLWMEDEPLVQLDVEVDAAFDQTPGPVAGRAL